MVASSDWLALLGAQVAPWGIVASIVFMILTDRLVTRGRLAQTVQERDAWKAAYQTEKDTNVELIEQARERAVVDRTMNHLLDSLPRRGGGSDAAAG